MRVLVFLCVLFCSVNSAFGFSDRKFDIHLVAKKGESLDTVAKRYYPKFSYKYLSVDQYKGELLKWNGHVTNWDSLEVGSKLYIDYPYLIPVSFNYAPPIEKMSLDGLNLFSFYTASVGSFIEENTAEALSVNFNQNSPITFGLMARYNFPESQQNFSTSIYFSYLQSGTSAQTKNTVSIPIEVGANVYWEFPVIKNHLWAYGGSDVEKFSTFNTNALAFSNNLELVDNKIVYGVAGLTWLLSFSKQLILMKGSVAKTLMSSQSVQSGVSKAYEGQRYLFFLGWITKSNITYQLLYKFHQLDNGNKLTISRIGLGFGYRFY